MPQKSKGTNTFSSYLAPFYNSHYLYSCSLTIFWYICMMCFLTRCLTFDRKFIESFNLICKYQATGMLSIVCLSAQVLAKIIHSSKRQWYCCNKCLQNVQNTLAAQSIFYTYIIQNTSNQTVRYKKKLLQLIEPYEECATYLPQKVSQESLNVFNCVIHCTYMLIQ